MRPTLTRMLCFEANASPFSTRGWNPEMHTLPAVVLTSPQKAWKEAIRINPNFSMERRRRVLPFRNPADFERRAEGLRKGGVAV
jgi:hypothetical protein